jgi:exodeoxyribonuclease V beta subunit
MSQALAPISFPLTGTRLIEASAGTGKTWTIAALYVRLVLGHGGPVGFARPLLPAEILVMTFTRAATKELSDRIRQRLVEAAKCFRGQKVPADDAFLAELIGSYPEGPARQQAAHRLVLAAEAMDDAGIFTIDAWCQRMLREHAFDSGCLFDEELVSSEEAVFRDAVRDYWRHHVYALDSLALARLRECWAHLPQLEESIRPLVERASLFGGSGNETLGDLIARVDTEQRARVAQLKDGWAERTERMEAWIAKHRKALNGNRLRAATVANCCAAIRDWTGDANALHPGDGFAKGWEKLVPGFLREVCNDPSLVPPDDFAEIQSLHDALAALEPIKHILMRHAATAIAARISELKRRRRQFGFADMLSRLRGALEGANGEVLRARILAQFPVALIDEFQDTSPDQYRIFDLLYRVNEDSADAGLFLIGDPKQAIYGFRGADIHSYLAARRATAGRHYRLGTNFRSTGAVVTAVNQLFLHAEGEGSQPGHAAGAFRFRTGKDNPLPFEAVSAKGRKERLVGAQGDLAALTIWTNTTGELGADAYRAHFAGLCAQTIVAMLNDQAVGFQEVDNFERLQPADIAVLVRNKQEAAAVRDALQRRGVPSVYLSDKDSVYRSEEAADVLRWLKAVANPLDGALARAAFATRTAGLSLAQLAMLASDDAAWEARVEQLKTLRTVWQRQGVLGMLRRFVHELALPGRLLREPGGERRMTDLLHLAEMLQTASQQLDGEQALIRWLAEQIENDSDGGDERILRLESDAELVKVVTVHKSKGLEYPLVFLPFAVSARKIDRRNRKFLEYADRDGKKVIDFTLSAAGLEAMDAARLEEDLRLLYVALTRARHALWMGVTSQKDEIHHAALGYLMAGGDPVTNAQLVERLQAMCGTCPEIRIETSNDAPGYTRLSRDENAPTLVDAPQYDAEFERHWSIASYTSITRDLGAMPVPVTALEEKLLDADDGPGPGQAQDAAWHRFPRGSLPGQFVHGQLEWMAREGVSIVHEVDFERRLGLRCERAGWDNRKDDAIAWLRAAVTTSLPPLGRSLSELAKVWPEMEFWVPATEVRTDDLDRLCQERLLDGRARPALQARHLHGMLRGFKDLVFELDGRYWVLDYKTNSLGRDDAAYHAEALADAMAAHRYDVQGTIYLLALHRLLKARLGDSYDPAKHLGGAVFFFMRGVANAQTRGCHHLVPDAALLASVDALLTATTTAGVAA